jgi:hypothetical protein
MVDDRSSDADAQPPAPRGSWTQFLQQLQTRLAVDPSSGEVAPPLASFSLPEILSEYLGLPAAERDALPPLVHAWFLNQLYTFPNVIDDAPPGAVRNLYFHCGGSGARPLVIESLLCLDSFRASRWREQRPSSLSEVWQAIEEDTVASPDDRYRMLEELLDLLVDEYDNDGPNVASALEQFIRDQRERHPDDPRIAARLRVRAEQLGGEFGSRLRQILGL